MAEKAERGAIRALRECIDLMTRKGKAYNRIPQAQYYPGGVRDIWVMIHQKSTRIRSLLEEPGDNEFESLEDSFKDLINYSAFAIEHLRGEMDGQQ